MDDTNSILRTNNILSSLLSVYTFCFHPMSTEPLCLIFFKSVEELNYHNAFIYIKVKKSIILPFQSKNNHIPTSFNLKNAKIKLFLETNVNTPIHNIIESFSVVYPRKD